MTKSRYFSTKALVIRKQNRNENDYYLTLFSPEHGKINAISKSSRKILSTKGGHLDSLTLSRFQLYKLGDNLIVTQCQTEESFLAIKSDLHKSLHAQIILEIVNRCLTADQESHQYFKLILETIKRIESGSKYHFYCEQFKITLLHQLGILPDLSRCFYSGERFSAEQIIYIDQNGHLCTTDTNPNAGETLTQIDFKLIKLINYIVQGNQLGENFTISEQELHSLQALTNIFLHNYLHQDIKAESLIKKLHA